MNSDDRGFPFMLNGRCDRSVGVDKLSDGLISKEKKNRHIAQDCETNHTQRKCSSKYTGCQFSLLGALPLNVSLRGEKNRN